MHVMSRNLHIIIFICVVLTALCRQAFSASDTCRMVRVGIERLPDLNIPRAGHSLFCVNGEITVAGGHTDGFVSTPTAEYLKDGRWHVMQMVYNHDFAVSVVMKSGKVLLLGGSEQTIGIGQTFLAERYDPATHTFDGFGILERKRTLASALELDSGQVVISGNWYHDDGIEVFDGKKHFTYIKDEADQRSAPHIFRISKDDALIVGFTDTKGDTLFSSVADRLKGDTVHIPLLESWFPLSIQSHRDEESFIGDVSKDEYIFLMPVRNKKGQVAIAKVDNGKFSLLPTDGPVPMQCQGTDIFYSGHIVVDRKAGRAYLMGHADYIRTMPEKESPLYILCIDYAKALFGQSAPLTLYYTDPLPVVPDYPPVVTDKGDLVIAGGLTGISNFTPSRAVYLLHLGTPLDASAQGRNYWLWLLLPVLIIGLLLGILILKHRRTHGDCPPCEQRSGLHGDCPLESPDLHQDSPNDELIQRIRHLMEEQRLYTNVDLKVSDIAVLLGTNSRYVSDCIKASEGCTFSQFVNKYRLEHAKRRLRERPDMKLSSIWAETGFASEQSFHRTFKQDTGLTPREWKNNG